MKESLKLITSINIVLFFAVSQIAAQSDCAVGGVNFGCPSKYFPEVKVASSETRIFRYKESKSPVFFFISVPQGLFDPDSVASLACVKDPKSNGLEWETESNPLLMDFKTNHKPDISVWLGLCETKLLEVKAFRFEVKNRKFILGYLSDLSEGPRTNRAMFKSAKGFADNAAGCSEVMTILNTVTKEFKDKDQGCTLTGLSGF